MSDLIGFVSIYNAGYLILQKAKSVNYLQNKQIWEKPQELFVEKKQSRTLTIISFHLFLGSMQNKDN